MGQVDRETELFSGRDVIYIYPDLFTAIIGRYDNGILVSGFMCNIQVKFIYSEKATKFCEISTLLLFYVVSVKIQMEISQNFVASPEDMIFKIVIYYHC